MVTIVDLLVVCDNAKNTMKTAGKFCKCKNLTIYSETKTKNNS